MRIIDGSSDVCSSDLVADGEGVLVEEGTDIGFHHADSGHEAARKRRFHGIAASRRAMPQKPVIPAVISPAPTKPLSRMKAGWTNQASRAPSRARPPATICTWRCRSSGALARSEEHTSELQSIMRISYAVFCLHKKKKVTCEW